MVMALQPFPQERDVSTTPETSDPLPDHRTASGRFAKGNPGGPGRPRGAVRGAASALDQVAVDASAELIKVAIELARAGNLEALKMVLARVWPLRRGRPLDIDVPAVAKVSDLSSAATRVADAVLQGELTPREGKEVSSLFEMHCRVLDTIEYEERLQAIEEMNRKREEEEKRRKTDRYRAD
jgi:hypothetical protein